MDEILIEEKKYVSSKRAAKITGYAKDYIGQLCREGRVSARLVGRSWYVLESAIQDHRFGKPILQSNEDTSATPNKAWEPASYEAAPVEELPGIVDPEEVVVPKDPDSHSEEPAKALEETWRSWFDEPKHGDTLEVREEPAEALLPSDEPQDAPRIAVGEAEDEVEVPIRTVYELPPEDLLPRFERKVEVREPTQAQSSESREIGRGLRIIPALQLVGMLVAVFFGITALLSTGFFDHVIGSFNQASALTGMKVFTR